MWLPRVKLKRSLLKVQPEILVQIGPQTLRSPCPQGPKSKIRKEPAQILRKPRLAQDLKLPS